MKKDAIVQDRDPNHHQRRPHAKIVIGATHHLPAREGKLPTQQFVRFTAGPSQEMKG
jgi:hypothetical protein